MFMNGEAGFVDKKTGFRLFSREYAELTENGVEINPELHEYAGKEWDLISKELNEINTTD